MTIKGLLISSTAILVPLSGALGGDTLVTGDVEPPEYVRVCDTYGVGFFYIPGTETCLRVSGYVWFQAGATNDNGSGVYDLTGDRFDGDAGNYNGFAHGWNSSSRAEINLDMRSETELGTLRAYARLQTDVGFGYDGATVLDRAYIQLAGWRVGHIESAWVDSTNEVSSYGSHSWNGMWTGYILRNLIQYNFENASGVFGAISVEDDGAGYGGNVPGVVGLLGYEKDWAALWLRVGYEESYGDNLHGFGMSLGSNITIGSDGTSFRLIGYYADGDHAYGTGGPTYVAGGPGNSEWSVLSSYYQQLTQTVGASVATQYFSDFYRPNSNVKTGIDGWSTEIAVAWTPITNFEIRSEVQYDDVAGMDGVVSGYLRITRSF